MAAGPDTAPLASPADEDDSLDLFSSGLEALFDEVVPCKGDPLQLYTYTPPAGTGVPPLTCRIPPQQVNSLFAHHVWNASEYMAKALAEKRLQVEGEDVVELGAGAGVPGLMAARMGARSVTLTDYDDPALIANLRSNIALAFDKEPEVQKRIRALGHSWGEEDSLRALISSNSSRPFSRILLADTLWYSSAHTLLLSSLGRLLARTPSARIHIVAGFHSGRATVRSFLRKARKVGLVRKGEWTEVSTKGERRQWGWDLKRREGNGGEDDGEDEESWEEKEDASERNKWAVEGDLGWSEAALREAAVETSQ
ncbi:hypothetical protein JCM8097_004777 [Rhodosporidiobolus ruineniae]